jgi:hypothetical protein
MTHEFPRGRLDRIYLHWSAGDYTTTFPVYHYCITWDGETAAVVNTHDLRANMRDVYFDDERPYAAHTSRRNAYSAGLSVMGMQGATPEDFGDYTLREECLDAMCALAAELSTAFDIDVDSDHIMTHAEAAILDGYFGLGDDHRWDMALLVPTYAPLTPEIAKTTGDELRARIARFKASDRS